jgi:transcriptional regulator with XRE-family HTH domain
MSAHRNTVQGGERLEITQKKKQRHLGPAILKYMEDHGISQAWLMRKLGVGRSTIHAMLHGQRDIKADEYYTICELLQVPVARFEAELRREGKAE